MTDRREPGRREPDKIYRYTDPDGALLYEVLRFETEDGKTFRQRRPDGSGGWVYNLDGVQRVPYDWPVLDAHLEDNAGEAIWIVEGEKDADRLAALGLTATTSAQGATWPWPSDWADHFTGASTVYVLADNDAPGRAAARARAELLTRTVPDVRLVELPDLPEKGDVSDWLDGGGDLDALYRIADASPRVIVEPLDDDPPGARPLRIHWVTESLADPPPVPTTFVEGFLDAGELTALVAPRAVGKSWLAYNLAALLSRGHGSFLSKLPVRAQARTLIAQGEIDRHGSASRWAHLANGLDDGPPELVAESWDRWRLGIRKVRHSLPDAATGGQIVAESFEAVLDPRIREAIEEHGFDVLVIDPWAVFFGGNENSNDEVEAALSELRHLSQATGVAIVIVHHISKVLDAREPEDLWRGASRLADWASTRVTLLPHYKKETQWVKAGKTRQEARRIVDVHFLRRSTPTDDFVMEWDPRDGWWKAWATPVQDAIAAGGSTGRNPVDVAALLSLSGGIWRSKADAVEALGVAHRTASKLLDASVKAGAIVATPGARGAIAYSLPAPSLLDPLDPELERMADTFDPDALDPTDEPDNWGGFDL